MGNETKPTISEVNTDKSTSESNVAKATSETVATNSTSEVTKKDDTTLTEEVDPEKLLTGLYDKGLVPEVAKNSYSVKVGELEVTGSWEELVAKATDDKDFFASLLTLDTPAVIDTVVSEEKKGEDVKSDEVTKAAPVVVEVKKSAPAKKAEKTGSSSASTYMIINKTQDRLTFISPENGEKFVIAPSGAVSLDTTPLWVKRDPHYIDLMRQKLLGIDTLKNYSNNSK